MALGIKGRRRKVGSGERGIERDIDERGSGIDQLERLLRVEDEGLMVVNDGSDAVKIGLIYGRTSGGRLSLAGAAVRPIYQALSIAAQGNKFEAMVIGPTKCVMAGTTTTVTRGALVWLDTANPGKVTPTKPTSGQAWMVGTFAGKSVDSGRRVDVDLFIFPQEAGGL